VQARRHDIVHVHSASTVAHSHYGAPRYVLHCHGTDVRVAQYDPARGPGIRTALRDAEAVFFATPDLAEHVLPQRPDALYVPVPVDVADIPPWAPADGTPRVMFASRWTSDKNSSTLLEAAAAMVKALDGRAEVTGLDWGPYAAEAAAAGVVLLPRCDHAAYLELLAGSHVVVGQATGMLGVSDLEALAAGAPLVVPVPLPRYADNPPPAYAGDVAVAVAATLALLDGTQAHEPQAVRQWASDNHGVEHAVDIVAASHRHVVAARK
jgi:hypothetical protein